MSVKANGTDAKEIALHFIKLTQERTTPHIIGKTIVQAKTLLASGYNKQEILDVITYLVEKKQVTMYSLGYVNSSINDVLREINVEKEKERLKELRIELASKTVERNEVNDDHDESTRRNQEKARRNHLQSRLRKKFNFDMFEEQ